MEAVPGESSVFSISVRNTGNAPAQYSLECSSDQRWQVMLGTSNSSQIDFEALNILEYLPMTIRVFVPLVADGVPAAGDTDTVYAMSSFTDLTMNFTETVTIRCLPKNPSKFILKTTMARLVRTTSHPMWPLTAGNLFT